MPENRSQPRFVFDFGEASPNDSQSFGGQHLFYQATENLASKFSRARYIGSFINKYLLFETNEALLIIDQHAAQERIMFEKFKGQIDSGKVETQPLLTPLLINLSPQERIIWQEANEELKTCGLETTLFDEETLALHTHPVLIKDPELAVRKLLSEETLPRCDHTTIARRACKASIRAGDKIRPEQIDHQRRELLQCRDPFTCPHGRPTMIELPASFIDRQFLRT